MHTVTVKEWPRVGFKRKRHVKFELIDRIVELTPRERIVTVKAVSLAEEYLADHFPTFPVLPGVLTFGSRIVKANVGEIFIGK